ncbi:MAG: DinB family protein [Candidatus Brockarchaeota archaeon]|nr:DinB family protein [Candidatus Brockarchaeota archaeon]
MDIKDLLEYNWFCSRKFLDGLGKLPWSEVVEDRGASFGSIRNIFLHSLEAEQGWFRHLARGKIGEWPSHDYDKEFQSVEAMRKYAEEVEAEGRSYLKKLRPSGLGKPFPIAWHGKSFRVEDVLMHVVEECLHHRGEIMCLMWQIDAEPPYTGYPGYLLESGKLKRSEKKRTSRKSGK